MNAEAGVRTSPHAGSVYDALILGGGLAGLSSVAALLDEGFSGNVTVVEPRARSDYGRDRTWCMWDIGTNPLAHLATHRWTRWVVRDDHRIVRASSERHPYLRIPADRVYQHLLERAESAPTVDLRLGSAVERLDLDDETVRVTTDREVLHGRVALDGRPVRWSPRDSGLLQSFVGWEVVTADPVFDTDEVVLMDFRLRAPGAIEFFYVLPLAPDRALVESTVFGTQGRSVQYHQERIDRYISSVLGTQVQDVEYTERGIIPMSVEIDRDRGPHNVRRIGLRGGVAKPSTGYAFLRIQDDSRHLAREMANGTISPGRRASSGRARTLDGIFLSFLRNQPDLAPDAFLSLFENVPADDLVAFLSEAGSFSTDWRVVRALPPRPFLGELARRARNALGSRAAHRRNPGRGRVGPEGQPVSPPIAASR